MIRRLSSILVVLAALGSWQTLAAQDYRVAPPGGPPDKLEAILQTAQPGSDEWDSEARFAEWDQALSEFAARLKSNGDLSQFIHGDFEGTPLLPARYSLAKRGAVRVQRGAPAAVWRAGVGFFLQEIGRWRNELATIDAAKFKIISVEPAASDIVFFVSGASAEGSPVQFRGEWRIEWIREQDSSWKIRRLRAGPLSVAQALRKAFRDVTAEALGRSDSYRQQLVPGVDRWRKRLDAALGVALTGHHGVSVADVNGDGWEDIYVPQPAGLPNLLYLNRGGWRFEDGTADSGLDVLDPTSQALFVDFDNDGDLDAFLVSSKLLLFRNDGRGRFTLAKDAGLDRFGERDGSWMAAAAADFDRDGWIDVYVAAHTQSAWVESPDADLPEPYHDANNGAPNLLLRNLGGRFAEVTDPGIQQNNRRFSFAAAWGDYDNDGDPDLYVANDFGRNNLYRNNGDGSFRDVAAEAGVEDLGAGMSVAWEDFDNDGRLDLYVGNMWSSAGLRVTGQDRFHNERNDVETAALQRHARGNSLFRNRGDGTFEDVTQKAGVGLGRWAWSSEFFDFDNDGLEDIYVANGFVTGEDTGDL
jgi:hypothetical protein